MPSTAELRDATLTPLLQRGEGSRAPMGAPRPRGWAQRLVRVPLSTKLLGANLLFAAIAATALVITHTTGESPTQAFVSAVVSVGFSLAVNLVLVTVALRPLRELERTAQRVWAGDLSVRARPSQTEDPELGRVRSAINLLLDGMSQDRTRMRRLALHAITVGDRERARVGRELHESSAQWLAGLTLGLSALARDTQDMAIRGELAALQETAQHVMEQVRSLSETLHPRVLDDLGLAPALQHLARKTTERGIPTTAETSGADAVIPRHVASVLYDVAREAVANAARHAAPARVELQLSVEDDRARLDVRDDGRGMDVGEAERGGFGLFSMRERVALLNGTFELESRPGGGTRVIATVSLHDEDGQ